MGQNSLNKRALVNHFFKGKHPNHPIFFKEWKTCI
jgi:hypothetical protein